MRTEFIDIIRFAYLDYGVFMHNHHEHNFEEVVITFFNMGALIGFLSILSGLGNNTPPGDLTQNITAAFLMSICGNCTRIINKKDAFRIEKFFKLAAVITYSSALFYDLNGQNETLGVLLKLATTGSEGAWNAAQIKRLYVRNPVIMLEKPKVNTIAFVVYCLGSGLGYGSMLVGMVMPARVETLKPFIAFAFLMSHCANNIRNEFNADSGALELNYIRAAVIFYTIALACYFSGKQVSLGVFTNLAAAGFVGLWNSAQTWRLNPDVYARVCTTLQTWRQEPAPQSISANVLNARNINIFFPYYPQLDTGSRRDTVGVAKPSAL